MESSEKQSMSVDELDNHLEEVIASRRFLCNEVVGCEVPIYICPYDSADFFELTNRLEGLVRRLAEKGVSVMLINLYDLAVDILRERDIWEALLEQETSVGKDQLLELLQGVLNPESHLVPAIASRLEGSDCNMLFLTGVGQLFPYVRSHSLLNNLPSVIKDLPVVLFFPGKFTYSLESGTTLELFSILRDDQYYRGFNICSCMP